MSIEAMNWALKQPFEKSSYKFVMLILANHADQDGVCWPSVASIIESTCLEKKAVQRALKYLRDEGWLVDTGERKGLTKQVIKYRLDLSKVGLPVDKSKKDNGVQLSSIPEDADSIDEEKEGAKSTCISNRVQLSWKQGAIGTTESKEPSLSLSSADEKNPETNIKTLCSRLKLKGISGASPLNAELLSLLNSGVSVDHILEIANEAVEKDKKSLGWIMATIKGRMEDARKLAEKPKAEPKLSKPSPAHASHIEVQPKPVKRTKSVMPEGWGNSEKAKIKAAGGVNGSSN